MVALLIISLIAAAAALFMVYVPSRWSAPLAFLAYILSTICIPGPFPVLPVVLWAASAAIVVGLAYMLPPQVADSSRGVAYIATAAIAGAAIGIAIGQNWLLLASLIGAILGALAFAKTPDGRPLVNPPKQFLSYICAKGFPVVVSVGLAAIAIFQSIILLAS